MNFLAHRERVRLLPARTILERRCVQLPVLRRLSFAVEGKCNFAADPRRAVGIARRLRNSPISTRVPGSEVTHLRSLI